MIIQTGKDRNPSIQDKQNSQRINNECYLSSGAKIEKVSGKSALCNQDIIFRKALDKWILDKIDAKLAQIKNKEEQTQQDLQLKESFVHRQFEVMIFLTPRKQTKQSIQLSDDSGKLMERIRITDQISLIVQKQNRKQTQYVCTKQILLKDSNEKYENYVPKEVKKTNSFNQIKNQNQQIQKIISGNKSISSSNLHSHQKIIKKQDDSSQNSNGSSVVDQQSSQITFEEAKTENNENMRSIDKINYYLNKSFIFESPHQLQKNLKQGSKLQQRDKQYRILPSQFNIESNKAEGIQNCQKQKQNQQKHKKSKFEDFCKENTYKNDTFIKKQKVKAVINQNQLMIQVQEDSKEIKKQERPFQMIQKFNQLQKQKIKKMQWYKQLEHLGHAQTQLIYMAQNFDWFVKFQQKNADPNLGYDKFQCKAEVKVIKNNIFQKFEGICQAQNSKKESRHHSAILCLAKLYYCVEGLWQKYEQKKKQTPSLIQTKSTDNRKILDKWLSSTEQLIDKRLKLQEEQKVDYHLNAYKYVQGLKNCKRQLYYFIAQNNKIFMVPRWKLKQPNMLGWWQAQGIIRYEIAQKIYEYRYKGKGKSKRDSEQAVSHHLLKKIYTDFPTLFKTYKKIKFQRGLI